MRTSCVRRLGNALIRLALSLTESGGGHKANLRDTIFI